MPFVRFFKELFTKEPRKVKAVDGIDLTIRKGEIVSLVGESGSGKTTTGRALLNLVHKTADELKFEAARTMTAMPPG